jgi:putative transposase
MPNNRKIIDDALYVHFVTFSVYKRRRLFNLDHPKRILLGVLRETLERDAAKCQGFVIMPDHVHGAFWFARPKQLSRFMHEWKRHSSVLIRDWYRTNAPEYFQGFGEGRSFWQAKYHSFEIDKARKLEEKLNYMHQNPVRAGLVQRSTDWKWSSARWYENRRSVGIPIEWVF